MKELKAILLKNIKFLSLKRDPLPGLKGVLSGISELTSECIYTKRVEDPQFVIYCLNILDQISFSRIQDHDLRDYYTILLERAKTDLMLCKKFTEDNTEQLCYNTIEETYERVRAGNQVNKDNAALR
jgi:hypothetical protein